MLVILLGLEAPSTRTGVLDLAESEIFLSYLILKYQERFMDSINKNCFGQKYLWGNLSENSAPLICSMIVARAR